MSTIDFSTPDVPVAARQPGLTDVRQPRTRARPRRATGADPTPDWRRSAACVERDLNTFFPIGNVGVAAKQQILEAKRICADCPVQPACLEWALEVGPEFGIFGGRTEDERRVLRRRNGTSTRWRNSPAVRVHRDEEAVTEALEPR